MQSRHLVIVLILMGSCKAQVNKNVAATTALQTIEKGQAKMVRTQGVLSGSVSCSVQDATGNLWFGTGGEGLYLYDGKTFTQYTIQNGLCDNNVNAMVLDREGNLLLATGKGVCRYNMASRNFTNLTGDNEKTKNVCSVLQDRDGYIWLGTMNNGLYRYDGNVFTAFLDDEDQPYNSVHAQVINHILQDSKGNIWFCSWSGGGVWQYRGQNFVHYIPGRTYYDANEDERSPLSPAHNTAGLVPKFNTTELTKDSLPDDMIYSATEDRAGNIWLATRRHGACCFNGKSFTSFREKEGFVSYGIYAIMEDKKGNLWFGTDKNGVFCYDGKTFKNFTMANGLVNNSVFSILEDGQGNLWFGTRGFGLSRYDGKTFTSFSE